MGCLALTLFLVAAPSLWFVVRVSRRDGSIHGARRFVWQALLCGLGAAVPVLLLLFFAEPYVRALAPGSETLVSLLVSSFLVAGLTEELFKLLAVQTCIVHRPEFDEATDGIRYTVAVSLGLAFLENAFYLTQPLPIVVLRSVFAVATHATASGVLGYFVGKAAFDRNAAGSPVPTLLKGLALAALIHGGYDFLLRLGGGFAVLLVPWVVVWALVLSRLFHRAHVMDSEARRPSRSPLA